MAEEKERAKRLILELKKKTVANGCSIHEAETAKKTIIEIQKKYFRGDIWIKQEWPKKVNSLPTFSEFDNLITKFGYTLMTKTEKMHIWGYSNGFYVKATHSETSGWLWQHAKIQQGTTIVLKSGVSFTSFEKYLQEMVQ